MISHLYRFRPLARLLDHGELQNQEIYFAKPEQLNDPMEGFRDIFWRGDEVVWENLFRHYLLCLERAYSLLVISGESEVFGWNHIPIFNHGDVSFTPRHKARLDKLVAAFLGDAAIQEHIRGLSVRAASVRRSELAAYLNYMHFFALAAIRQNYREHGLLPDEPVDPELGVRLREGLAKSKLVAEQIARLEASGPDREQSIDAIFTSQQKILSELALIHLFNGSLDPSQTNRNFVFLTFCEEYVQKIETLVYPDWFTACFMRDCENSSVWGGYGNNHTAACLKFKVRESHGKPVLRLRRQNGISGNGPTYGHMDHEFHEIIYENEHLPVDFFRSLGRLPIPTLTQYWYGDQKGRRSVCGDDIFKAEKEWNNRYWNAFYHAITRKLKAWSHEQEYRLILSGMHLDFSEDATRKVGYDFNDLDGIIFGIKTPTAKKLEIIKIIEEKCRAVGRRDFKFYQAFYSRSKGQIEHQEMTLLKFKFTQEQQPASEDKQAPSL